ncbi:FecR family protein [Temperatibacter marinus]|uniref:FecR family protein n=1 Tax=Temperatibacter marinus TaxID=1456591 RepID=A0AA52H9L8_9PROT|nr:FecR family protein [Temperatibacter marinus]WND01748.1 FecR family protein [Temperatibacter marinus]
MSIMSKDTIKKEAADWVAVVYSGNASQEDETNLDLWLGHSDQHMAEYERALALWDLAVDAAPTKKKQDSVGFVQLTKIGAVAAVLLIVLTSFMMRPVMNETAPVKTVEIYTTHKGETQDITLLDGSVITLNTDTKLYVDYSDGLRRVILDKGEAYFDVARDPANPFVVSAGNQMVTVLGTQFNVRQKASQLTVAVVEGLVAVHEIIETDLLKEKAQQMVSSSETNDLEKMTLIKLEAGSVGVFHKKAELLSDIMSTDAEKFHEWRQGIVKFSDQPLSEFVMEMSRYTPMEIIISDPRLADLKISGVFHYEDIQGIMSGLEVMLPVKIRRVGNRILIEKKTES